MRDAPFVFRYRLWIILALFALGFAAPWDYRWHLDGTGPNTHLWGRLAIELSRAGINISVAFNLVLALGVVCAFAAAALRTWGSAYLGPGVVRDQALHGDAVVAAGPYRHVRNPLYVGSMLNAAALALLMPATGAVLALLLLTELHLILIRGEERFLTAQRGQAYVDYCARVPRIFPSLRAAVASDATVRPAWGRAALAEIFAWGTAASFAAVGWQYNAHLLIQCVLVAFGVSLIVRGAAMRPVAAETKA